VSEKQKKMSEKQKKIKEILEMQHKFLELDKAGQGLEVDGLSLADYFAPTEESPLHNFTDNYRDLANEIVDMAHKERGSKR